MKKFLMAASGGILAGAVLTTQIAGPLIAQDTGGGASVYQQAIAIIAARIDG